jgi:hypothetical protein
MEGLKSWLAEEKFEYCLEALQRMVSGLEGVVIMDENDVHELHLSSIEFRRFLKALEKLRQSEKKFTSQQFLHVLLFLFRPHFSLIKFEFVHHPSCQIIFIFFLLFHLQFCFVGSDAAMMLDAEVREWLRQERLVHVADRLSQIVTTLSDVMELQESDLDDIGLKKLEKSRLFKAIEKLRAPPETNTLPSAPTPPFVSALAIQPVTAPTTHSSLIPATMAPLAAGETIAAPTSISTQQQQQQQQQQAGVIPLTLTSMDSTLIAPIAQNSFTSLLPAHSSDLATSPSTPSTTTSSSSSVDIDPSLSHEIARLAQALQQPQTTTPAATPIFAAAKTMVAPDADIPTVPITIKFSSPLIIPDPSSQTHNDESIVNPTPNNVRHSGDNDDQRISRSPPVNSTFSTSTSSACRIVASDDVNDSDNAQPTASRVADVGLGASNTTGTLASTYLDTTSHFNVAMTNGDSKVAPSFDPAQLPSNASSKALASAQVPVAASVASAATNDSSPLTRVQANHSFVKCHNILCAGIENYGRYLPLELSDEGIERTLDVVIPFSLSPDAEPRLTVRQAPQRLSSGMAFVRRLAHGNKERLKFEPPMIPPVPGKIDILLLVLVFCFFCFFN